MKKRISIVAALLLFLVPTYALSYISYFGFDSSVDMSLLTGFQFDVLNADPNDLTLTLYNTTDQVDIDSQTFSGAFPANQVGTTSPWTAFTADPSIVVYDLSSLYITPGDGSPLSAGVALSIEGTSPFSLSNFIFSSDYDPLGAYPIAVNINEASLAAGDGMTYTASSVPLPSALILLGSGLAGLVGFRRRRMN
jgi:hypothetical protein